MLGFILVRASRERIGTAMDAIETELQLLARGGRHGGGVSPAQPLV
jgi:hypothetical protein